MRFGIPAIMWGVLLVVAWSRQRDSERPREKWLVWGFGLALARELFMFGFISLQISGVTERHAAYFISAPLEQALTMASIVVIAAAFLRYILDDASIARRYLRNGLLVTLLCYLAIFWWWAGYSRANPGVRFGQSWASGLFHMASALLLAGAIFILYKNKGWLRNVMMVALSIWFIADIVMLISLATDDISTHVISHSLYILAIPLLGYIYIREQTVEREEAVSALRESEQRLREILDHTQAGYFFMDRQGQFQQVNKAWLQMHGYSSAAEVIGRHYSFTHPDEVAREVQEDIQMLLDGEVIPTRESMRLTKDGTIKYHTSSFDPVMQGSKVIGLEGFLIDRSEQVQAEAEVQRRNEQMAVLNAIAATISETLDLERMLASILESVIAVTNMNAGWIVLYNDQGSLQLVAEYGIIADGDNGTYSIDSSECPVRHIALSGEPLETLIPNDASWLNNFECCGECAPHFAGVPVISHEQIQGVLAVLGCNSHEVHHDVQLLTAIAQQIGVAVEKAQLAEEASRVKLLQELDRLRSELIANVSHDLRTPLGLIKLSSTSLLATDIEFNEEVRQELLGVILDETDRLEKIVDDLLLLAQVESGRLQIHKRRTPAPVLIEQAIKGMDAEVQQHQIEYEVNPPSLIINLDPDRMEQVLCNLLSNAIKYSPQGGTIRIEAYADGKQAFLTVADQGIGIPAQELERVFDRFYRLDNPITRHVRGAGLGLAVCRNMVRAHDGHIWVKSTPGQGSTFFITLPLGVVHKDEPILEEAVAA
jgi:two-component system sensor histidine kinase KdpD